MNTHHSHDSEPLAKRVIERIEEEHITPRPRWEFLASNAFFWTLAALSVALGALAAAASLFELANADWQLYAARESSFFTFLFSAAPFLWLAALALLILIGYANIRRTKRGYRYPLSLIVLGAVLTSLVLGFALFALGLGEAVEEGIGTHAPFYRPIVSQEEMLWDSPSTGVVSGRVVKVAPDFSSFVLLDWSGTLWQVEGSDLRAPDDAVLAAGGPVRVVGLVASGTSAFHACFVFPWAIYGGMSRPANSPAFATTSEISRSDERSAVCRGIRPYQALRAIHGE